MARNNGITINSIMNMDFMSKCNVIAGLKGINNSVSRVNIMADPDAIDWVEEGELLLTTAYSFSKDNIQAQKELIKGCAKKGLAGIGIKIHPYLESLSEELISLANELSFPIIDLYYAVPFSTITTYVFQEIFNRQTLLLQRVETIHEELMNAMLQESSIHDISKIIYKNLNNPIVIKLQFSDDLIFPDSCLEELDKDVLISNALEFYSSYPQIINERKLHEDKILIKDKYIDRMIMPIVVKNRVFGHVFLWGLNTSLGGFDLAVMETASTTMSLKILRDISIIEVENRYRSEFLEDLLSLDKTRRKRAVQRLHLFNLFEENDYTIAVVEFNVNLDKNLKLKLKVDNKHEYIDEIIFGIESILKKIEVTGIVARRADRIEILISFEKNTDKDELLRKFKLNIKDFIYCRYRDLDYKVGIGRSFNGIESVSNSLKDAERAIKTGQILEKDNIIRFDSLGIYKILCQDGVRDELKWFYEETLKPLDDYDNKKSTELVKTLEAYFYCNGNLKKMSDSLFTHYNTVLYRVQRIKEITGKSLDNPDHRLSLEIALKIKKLLI